MGDSVTHWLKLRMELPEYDVTLGRATAQGYVTDPRMIAFIAARYKFVAKMLEGRETVLEVGCGDAFGAPIVAQTVKQLICTDIDEETLALNQKRNLFPNIDFRHRDFRRRSLYSLPQIDAAYLVDVIEHIYSHEAPEFIDNLCGLLHDKRGVLLIGTPNKTAEAYASPNSRHGHVNLHTHQSLKEMLRFRFHNVFMFGQNDEVVHTGYAPMCQYLWGMGVGPR